ncbi:DUF2197 domain-containing protein [Oceanobacillus sp. 143]|uniref:DUF2197 domain-containing protein n=1 Tax=Oceanobacillus zhaokaii TaxID=2052660 RepID=A0A345PG30_9BACI|nr:YlaI family protein [Oceanobacillus zhaokaii]AXI08960.1 DUF2197 domain-containing protein [Oceanobacillus zhaokaii]QGS68595.1 DUF2197 domain-containing protein [Oceanobacillus sp. 143]
MQVKCSLCDQIDVIDDNATKAKRLRNRRIYMYLCKSCYDRIEYKTTQRHETGNFRLYREKKKPDDFF